MQRSTGAKVQVERAQGGADVRLVCCFGTLRQVTLAAAQVMDLAGVDSVILLVPNEICGMIIGKQGANIKKLSGETGAHLKVESDFDQVRRIFVGGELSIYLSSVANPKPVGPIPTLSAWTICSTCRTCQLISKIDLRTLCLSLLPQLLLRPLLNAARVCATAATAATPSTLLPA
eukprot:1182250-Prorocentrum_minimum.AAC.1